MVVARVAVEWENKTVSEVAFNKSKRGVNRLSFFINSNLIFKKHTMNKRIAIPLENGILCPHFGHCQTFAIVDVTDSKINNVVEITPPEHQPGLYPKWIAQHRVTDVIAGGMGQRAIDLFNEQHINVFVGAPMKDATMVGMEGSCRCGVQRI